MVLECSSRKQLDFEEVSDVNSPVCTPTILFAATTADMLVVANTVHRH
jgi:hypothetical protein